MTLRSALLLAFALPTLTTTLTQCGTGGPDAGTAAMAQDPAAAVPPADRMHLLISGALSGRLEPCGCASGQLGGLARRMQHIGVMRNYDLLLEGGDLAEGTSELDVQKLLTTNTVLFGMERQYDAVGVGKLDLQLPLAEWSAFLAGAPVVASNLDCADPAWPGKPFVEKQVRGIDVRIGSLLLELPESLRGEGAAVKLLPAKDGYARMLAGSKPEARRIVFVHGDEAPIRALIPQLQPAPDLVIGVDHGYTEPSPTPQSVEGVPLVFTGIRGRVLLDVWLHREAKGGRATCELVPLVGSKTIPGGGGDPDVKNVILDHRKMVKEAGVLERMARLKPTQSGAAYVGTATCATCHPTAAAAWGKSAHAHAWATLVKAEQDPKRYGWPVTAYPECVSCHVVGYGEQTGFVSAAETPQLADVGCERCHGPGSVHMANPAQNKLGLIGGVQGSVLCTQCHDFEQSPNFLYGDKWPLIQHGREAKK